MGKLVPIVIVMLVTMLACNKPNVTANDVVGTWTIMDKSRIRLPSGLQQAPAKFVMDASGNFAASDIPGLLYVNPGPVNLDTGNGSWRLVTREKKQFIQLDFRAIARNKERDVPFGTQLYVSKTKSAMTLLYYLGDPDEGKKIEFEKR